VLLMAGIALSLDLPDDAFAGFCQEPMGMIRLFHYPPQPANPKPNKKGAGAHTDWGALTILLQDDAGGLQPWDEREGWLHAAPIPGTFVVNLGDLMARRTNDLFRSTKHRVVNLENERPKYPPTTPGQHLAEVYRLTYTGGAGPS